MSTRLWSLRGRLTAIILVPLLVVASLVGLWQLFNARQTAADVFDRSLLSAALAVANDVANSGGDALSPETRDILADTSGAPVFYHVYAPDGVIVAGYATPPVGIPRADAGATGPSYFEARYLGRDVHGVRLANTTQIDGFAGIFTTTVWQDAAARSAFVQDLVTRSLVAICGLITSLALIVWFGVRIGLRPVLDLEEAIARRTIDDLSPIQRAVPNEIVGVVRTLNRLFEEVSRTMTAQTEFISNAAHQLKNPIAGVLALAETVVQAKTEEATKARAKDLLEAAQETAALSQKLLLLERAKAISPISSMEHFDLRDALEDWKTGFNRTLCEDVRLDVQVPDRSLSIYGDPVMLREAIGNLIDNAVRHGGSELRRISVQARAHATGVEIYVDDDGKGLKEQELNAMSVRFKQGTASSGSGLGVSIVDAVAKGHGGRFEFVSRDPGLRAALHLPYRI